MIDQLKKAQAEYEKFPTEFMSIMMSTISKEGIPDASYAPFVIDDDKNIYIYVSGLATHTQNSFWRIDFHITQFTRFSDFSTHT
jgi:putative heme iron utilization protein